MKLDELEEKARKQAEQDLSDTENENATENAKKKKKDKKTFTWPTCWNMLAKKTGCGNPFEVDPLPTDRRKHAWLSQWINTPVFRDDHSQF